MKPTTRFVVAAVVTAIHALGATACAASDGNKIIAWMQSCDAIPASTQSKCDDRNCHIALHRLIENDTADCYVQLGLGPASALAKYKPIDAFCHGEGPDPNPSVSTSGPTPAPTPVPTTPEPTPGPGPTTAPVPVPSLGPTPGPVVNPTPTPAAEPTTAAPTTVGGITATPSPDNLESKINGSTEASSSSSSGSTRSTGTGAFAGSATRGADEPEETNTPTKRVSTLVPAPTSAVEPIAATLWPAMWAVAVISLSML